MDVSGDRPARDHCLAIVGRAGRFPTARNVDEFWSMLAQGRSAGQRLTDAELLAEGVSRKLLADPGYVRVANILPDMECFDASFFGFSPREAAILDPQHRHFLECGWEALEDAGHMPEHFQGRIGVFAGSGMQAYLPFNLLTNPDLREEIGLFLLRHTGNDKDFLPTRLSYLLNLTGPSIAVQTACSTSLVAVHMAIGSLLNMECDMAIAGGVTIELPHRVGYKYVEGEILSPDGLCRAFDNESKGTVFGSGAALVVLRRYNDAVADGDDIKAVILASAINNDGSCKASYLAPSVDGQAEAAAEALALSGIKASDISYIEMHGTGTPIGDPIELTALQQVYGSAEKASIGIGSVKTNIGHLDTAAGAAGLIKVVEALRHRRLPANLHFRTPNCRFEFDNSPFRVVAESREWQSETPRRAAVNSLGVGGTNAHVIVEEGPTHPHPCDAGDWTIFPISARTAVDLERTRSRWNQFLGEQQPPAKDISFTLRNGRRTFPERFAIAARDTKDLHTAIAAKSSPFRQHGSAPATPPRIVFLFPGGGAQYPGAGAQLLVTSPAFAEAVHECFSFLPPNAPLDLYETMFEPDPADEAARGRLARSSYAIPALFILEYAYARLWETWDIRPQAILAHSVGEYAGAVISGAIRLKDALRIITLRGKVMDDAPRGAMITVPLEVSRVRELVGETLDIAAINTESSTVVAGPVAEIERLEGLLAGNEQEARRIRIDVAAHSRQLDGQLDNFRAGFSDVSFGELSIPMVSSMRGDWAQGSDLRSTDYWVEHLRNTVRFSDAVRVALEGTDSIVIEIGPGQTLGPLVAAARLKTPARAVIASAPRPRDNDDEMGIMLAALGGLWVNGVDVDWSRAVAPGGRRVSLPTYAFARERHWIEPGTGIADNQNLPAPQLVRIANPTNWFEELGWTERPRAGASPQPDGNWLVFCGEDAFSANVLQQLRAHGAHPLIVRAGENFGKSADTFTVRPHAQDDFDLLAEALPDLPTRILYLWSVDGDFGENAFSGAYLLCRLIQQADPATGVRLAFVTRGSASIGHESAANPRFATLLGAVRVAPHEIPGLTAVLIDAGIDVGADELLSEVASSGDADHVVLRQRRYVRTRSVAPIAAPHDLPRRLRSNGTYLIIGGTGGIGRELAIWLASCAGANLALLSRSAREDETLRREVETHGGQVIFLKADVSDPSTTHSAVTAACERFGDIHGVIHAAGILNDAPLAAQPLDEALAVMKPKLTGGLVLDKLFPEGSLDFFAVISSTSVQLGGAGQTAYAGANAALEALAERRSDGFVIALGAWRDIGMAARIYGAGISQTNEPSVPGTRTDLADGTVLFESIIDPTSDWRAADHVINGSPVFPGTAYIELAHAAAIAVLGARLHAFEALQFSIPMVFDSAPRRITVGLQSNGVGYDLAIESRTVGEIEPVEHMRTRVVLLDNPILPRPMAMPHWPRSALSGKPLQGNLIDFGDRWRCVGDIHVEGDEVAARFALAPAYASDLARHPLHPAMLDMATTIGMATAGRDGGLYAPMSIGRMQVSRPLPARIVSHAERISGEPGRFISFNVSVCDEDGNVLVQIKDFVLRAVTAANLSASDATRSLTAQILSTGIRRNDAPDLFARIFDHTSKQIVVSPVSLDLVRLAMTEKPNSVRRVIKQRQQIADPMTARLAEIWTDILGVVGIDPDDDFFALGGHSLNAVRMLARVRKEFGVSVPLGKLFESARLSALTEIVRRQVSSTVNIAEAIGEVEQSAPEVRTISMTEGQREIAGSILVNPAVSLAYNLSFSLHIAGKVDSAALSNALVKLVERHDVFRASFDLPNTSLTIHPARKVELAEHDLSTPAPQERATHRRSLLDTAARTPFDLAGGPLLRPILLHLSPDNSELVLLVHHIACDGWSIGVVMRDLAELYSAYMEDREPALPDTQSIGELVDAEERWRRSPEADKHRAFWTEKYSSTLPVLDLPLDKPRLANSDTAAAREVTRLDAELEKALRARAKEAGTSLRNLIFAAFRFYLSRLAGTGDVVVGLPAAAQLAHGLENVVGHGINLLPICAKIDRDSTLGDLVRQARQDILDAVEHQNYTHGALVRDLHMPRDISRPMLAPVVMNIDGLADLEPLRFYKASVQIDVNSTGHEFFDLFINQFDAPGRVELTWNYKTALFEPHTIRLHAKNFEVFLREIAQRPDALALPAASLLRGDHTRPASGTHGDPGASGPQTVTEIFRDVATRHADGVAQCFGSQRMTYAELDRRSDALAAMLIGQGIVPGDLVGISSNRSLSLLVAVMGVLKAGAGYVPFDVQLPPSRLQFMARDTGIRILLGNCRAVVQSGVRIIPEEQYPTGTAIAPNAPVNGTSIAYVMFTSGTTGVPKGVVLPHRSIIRMLCGNHWVKLSSQTVTLHSSAFAFDTSIIDIFGALLHGGTVVIPPDGKFSISDLSNEIQNHGVNTLWLTSGLFHAVADSRPEAFINVSQVVVGGDVVSPTHVARVMSACPNLIVINGYGPTESNVTNAHAVTAMDLASGSALPIGPAIAGTQVYILDDRLQPVPDGIIGELCIAGRGLALGYWNRPDLTAEKFIAAPWDPRLRLYRSGDLAMNSGDGVVRFYGRADSQVKIRGFRVELAEVEAVLQRHPAIRQVVVIAAVPSGQTDKVLAAYFVTDGNTPVASDLKAYLADKLPDFAIPSYFIGLDAIPLNANGKPDRRKLPPLLMPELSGKTDTQLKGKTEIRLAAIWSDILGIKVASAQANFFELGGHSLLAVRLFDRIRREFGHDLPIATLFRRQTVRQLATMLDGEVEKSAELHPDGDWNTSTVINAGPGNGSRPLFIVGGVGGNVNNLVQLGKALGEQRPVIGFQTRGIQGHNPHHTIEAMAAENLRYLRQHQPSGPYLIAGYSGGALTAFEMARQLEAQDAEVERLFVLDTYAPGFASDFRPMIKLGCYERLLGEAQLLYEEGFGLFYERLVLKVRGKLIRGPILRLMKRVSLSRYRYQQMQEVFWTAARQYRHASTIECPVTLFRTRPKQLLNRRAHELDPTLGWGSVSRGGCIDAEMVSGDHLQMLESENARKMAEMIEARIKP